MTPISSSLLLYHPKAVVSKERFKEKFKTCQKPQNMTPLFEIPKNTATFPPLTKFEYHFSDGIKIFFFWKKTLKKLTLGQECLSDEHIQTLKVTRKVFFYKKPQQSCLTEMYETSKLRSKLLSDPFKSLS